MSEKIKTEEIYPSENVKLNAVVELYRENGKVEELDTSIVLQGRFSVAGGSRREFYKKLGELINEYRI